MYRKILSWLLTLAMVFTMIGGIGLENVEAVPNFIGYGWNQGNSSVSDGPISISYIGPDTLIKNINPLWMTGGDFVGGDWYTVSYNESNSGLYIVNPNNGDYTKIGDTGQNLTGFTYSTSNDTAYVSSTDLNNSYLHSIDLTTGNTTQIGIMGPDLIIGIAADSSGNLFGITLNSDSLVSINTTTGLISNIGSLGIDINYAQDIGYDRKNNVLYGTLYTSSGGLFCSIDTNTGVVSQIRNIEGQISALAIPYLPDIWGIEIESTDLYPFDGGDGTSEATAYEISTENQLAQLAYNVNNGNNYSGKYFKLTSDIDLSGKEWVPIGKDYNHRFMGNFDGDNFKIEGLTITTISYSENYGLFGYLGENGDVSNLIIESGKIELTESPANSIGIGGVAGYSTGLISNCTNKIDIIADHNSEIYAGGIVGIGNSSTSWSGKIENCYNEGDIILGDKGAAGGIIGAQFNSNSYTYIRNSSNKGNITGGRSVEIGGIAGWLNGVGFRDNPLINCYNTGNLTTGTLTPDSSIAGDIGGIVGYLYIGTVENSFNTGDIEVLYSDTANTSGFYIGGLVGYSNSPAVKNSYNTGIITGPEDRIGPISGANGYYTAHANCYHMEGSVPNSLINTGATKLTEKQMKGIDASTILFINSSDEEVTYGPANGAFIYALNNGKSEETFSWYYDERYNDGYPILYYNNEVPNVISFDPQGGTSVSAVTIKDGDSINTSPITSKEEHTFKGWFTKSEKGIEISFPFEPVESIVLYAQWVADEEPEEPTTTTRPSVPKLEIKTEMLPGGVQGEEYQLILEGEGGRDPYTWSAEGLPEGLLIDKEGNISGVPEESGIFSVKIELLDSRNYYRSGLFDLEIVNNEFEGEDSKEDKKGDSFLDINNHWSKEYIEEAKDKNLINGYPDGTFRPENKVTREEFASLLVRALKLEKYSDTTFEDIIDRWSTENISTAAYYKIIKGYDENKFGPEDFITREQMAVMIARALVLEESSVDIELNDIQNASSWAKNSIISVVNEGLVEGYPDGSFKPMNNLTRAEAVKVIYSIMK